MLREHLEPSRTFSCYSFAEEGGPPPTSKCSLPHLETGRVEERPHHSCDDAVVAMLILYQPQSANSSSQTAQKLDLRGSVRLALWMKPLGISVLSKLSSSHGFQAGGIIPSPIWRFLQTPSPVFPPHFRLTGNWGIWACIPSHEISWGLAHMADHRDSRDSSLSRPPTLRETQKSNQQA